MSLRPIAAPRHHASAGRLMLAVLSEIAEFGRDLILQRTNEGALAPWPRVSGSVASRS